MKKKWSKTAKRMFALFLCVALVLPMLPQTVWAAGSELVAEGILGSNNVTGTAKATASSKIKLTRYAATANSDPAYNDQIALMSDKYGFIMSYDAYSTSGYASDPTSLTRDDDGDSENTYYFNGNDVIIDHSDRDAVLWVLKQYDAVANKTSYTGDAFSRTNSSGQNADEFFGTKNANTLVDTMYIGAELQKGIYGRPNNKGERAGTYGYHWYCTNNAAAGWYTHLCFRSDSSPFKDNAGNSTQTGGDVRDRYRLERLSDGTFLIYYYAGKADFRLVYCDENGHWGVKRIQKEAAEIKAMPGFEEFKLRLYKYETDSGSKNVNYKGYTTYDVVTGVSKADVLEAIQDSLTVFDPDRKNQHIPGNGQAYKAGYYWLDGNLDTSKAGTYTLTIKYSNDDSGKTSTALGTVTVRVAAFSGSLSATTGIVSKNAAFQSVVYKASGTAATTTPITITYGGVTVPVTLSMLYKDGKQFDPTTPGTYSVQVKYAGAAVGTMSVIVDSGTIAPHVPGYPQPGSVVVGKKPLTTQDQFSTNGLANIRLSATGVSTDRGVDLIVMIDLSSSMRYKVGTTAGGYVCEVRYGANGAANPDWTEELWAQTRMYEMEQGLKAMINSLKTTGVDVRVAISDFGDLDHFMFPDAALADSLRYWPQFETNGKDKNLEAVEGTANGNKAFQVNTEWEFYNHLNYVIGKNDINASHPSWRSMPFGIHHWKFDPKADVTTEFRGVQTPKIYTGTENMEAGAFMDITAMSDDKMEGVIDELRRSNSKMLGTNYDVGLEYAYRLGYERRQANIEAGEDRDIICVFMSDGAAMQYNYFSGRSQTEAWSQYLIGETDEILQNSNASMWPTGNLSETNYDSLHPTVKKIMTELHKKLYNKQLKFVQTYDANGDLNNAGPSGITVYNKCSCTSTPTTGKDFVAHWNASVVSSGSSKKLTWDRLFALMYHNYKGTNDQQIKDWINELSKPTDSNVTYQTNSRYNYFYNAEGKNWWAEAMKGDPGTFYPVINKYAVDKPANAGTVRYVSKQDLPQGWYNGEVENRFSGETTQGLALAGKDYISGFMGLGMKLYTVGFSLCDENCISASEAATVLKNIATAPTEGVYYFAANTETPLADVLTGIVRNVTLGATQLYFTDTLGAQYDLAGTTIAVKEYAADANGQPTGNALSTIETITLNLTNRTATSSLLPDKANIWDSNGVIQGDRVKYNTNKTGSVNLTLDTSGRTYPLAAETFFWIIGNAPEKVYALEYQVYLTDSMKVDTNAANHYRISTTKGTYATNASAVLHYIDYLGNNAEKATVSPTFTWGASKTEKIVIDYGLPVEIDIINSSGNYTDTTNGETFAATITGLSTGLDSNCTTGAKNEAYGKVEITTDKHKVKYTPSNMKMNGYDSFTCKVTRTDGGRPYYCTVYVIPATVMYYEDCFVTSYNTYTTKNTPDSNGYVTGWPTTPDSTSKWSSGTTPTTLQQVQRVGGGSVYGNDSHYTGLTDSMGTYRKVTVTPQTYAEAIFTFTGTGFDLISRTSSDTGTITVDVYSGSSATGTPKQSMMVDTYYGYKYASNKWQPDTSSSNTLYQVPVVKMDLNTHGTYTVKVTVAYSKWLDHKAPNATSGSYDFYLDAIRVYNPATNGGSSAEIQNAYAADGERWPVYQEVRDMLISANDFDCLDNSTSGTATGVVFIDNTADTGKNKVNTISDYTNYGPKNEVYLVNGQSIAFNISKPTNTKEIHLALKSVGTSASSVTITSYSGTTQKASKTLTISSATDLYYDITSMVQNGYTLVIKSTGTGILSITNLKTTYTSQPTAQAAAVMFVSRDIKQVVAAMNAAEEIEQPEQNSRVEGLEQTAATQDAFTVSWDAFDGAAKYWVYVNGIAYSSTTDTTLTITKRAPGTAYNVAVVALLNDGTLLSLDDANVITAQTEERSVVITSTSNSITLTWDVTGCTKTWIYLGTSADQLKVYDLSTTNSYTVMNLRPNTQYYFKLAHFVDGKIIESDEVLVMKTAEQEGTLDVDAQLSGDVLVLNWNTFDDSYKYWILVDGVVYYGTTETTFTLTGFDFESCTITIKGAGSNGMFEYNPVEINELTR